MIPILYESTETQFTSNGICRLRSCSEVTVTEERNGLYECDFSYPINGENYNEIQLGRIIAVRHDDTADIQPFDIVEREAEINGIVTFHCVHISYRQAKIVAHGKNITGPSAAFNMFADGLPNNPFSYFTDIISTKPFPLGDDVPRSVREMLGGTEGSVLDTYGGEFEWDKFDVRLWESRGETADFSIRYGVNMTAYNDEMDSLETYSAIIPYWSGQNEQNQPVVIWGDMVTNNEVTVSGRTECVPMDFSQDFEEQPTKQQLEDIVLEYLENHDPTIPARTIKVEFVQTQDSGSFSEFKRLQKCRLCDSVRVVFPRYGMNGYFKIVKTVFDVLQERYTEMELGTLSTTLAEALGVSQFGSDNKPTAGQSASYSGNVLRFGNLRIYTGKVNVANTGRGSITFPTGTFSQVITAIPYCGQGGFGGYDTTSVTELTTSKVTLYQYNSAGASMDVGVVVIGLA